MKKSLVVLGTTCLIFAMMLVSQLVIHKAYAISSGDYEYTVTDGNATITKYTGSGGDIVIPSQIDGYPVTAIGSEAFAADILIGEDDMAGEWDYKIKSVVIPNSVTSIGDKAFFGDQSLTSVMIPNSVTKIGYGAFSYCSSLSGVIIPTSVTSIEDSTFANSGLKSVIIPDSVTNIGNSAFYRDSSLMSVTIPNSVTSIGNSAFSGDSSLTSVTIPNSVTKIGNEAFGYTSSLTSVTVPGSVTEMGGYVFGKSTNLKSVVIEGGVSSISEGMFYKDPNLESVTIPNTVTSIGSKAFKDDINLQNVTIPDQVTSIGDYAFYGCSLQTVTLPNGETSIGDNAFGNKTLYANWIAIPTNVNAMSTGYSSLEINWSPVFGANYYQIYRSTSSDGNYSFVAAVHGASFTDTGLKTGVNYFYKVRAYKSAGSTKLYGNYSNVANARPVPAAPTNPKAESAGFNSIKINWSSALGASSYQVYRLNPSTGTYTLAGSTSSTIFKDTGLTTGITYSYKVRAYTTVGTTRVYGSYSTVANARPVPGVPTNLKAVSAGYNSIKVNWRRVSGASYYQLFRSTSIKGTYSLVTTTTSTSFMNTGLTTGFTYYYKVRAFKKVGTTKVYGSYSSVVNTIPIPETPSNFKVTRVTSNSIKISYSGVSGASGYQVYSATSSTGTFKCIKDTTSLYYINKGLTTGKTYYYKVRAYRFIGKTKIYSNWSVVLNAKP